jgi:hypothetical protein
MTRIPPFDVARSISGPPAPIRPSTRFLLSWLVVISNSVLIDPFDVDACNCAFTPSGSLTLIDEFVVRATRPDPAHFSTVTFTDPFDVANFNGNPAAGSATVTSIDPFDVVASSLPFNPSPRIRPFDVFSVAAPS